MNTVIFVNATIGFSENFFSICLRVFFPLHLEPQGKIGQTVVLNIFKNNRVRTKRLRSRILGYRNHDFAHKI